MISLSIWRICIKFLSIGRMQLLDQLQQKMEIIMLLEIEILNLYIA